jgi:acyl-CoA thioesterase I
MKQTIFSLSTLLLLALLSLIAATYSSPKPNNNRQPKHVNIICIGDSITQGGRLGRPEYTYRYPLQKLLKKSKLNFDFIGTRQQGLDASFKWPADFDPNHEGFYGTKPEIVRDKVKEDLLKLPPPDIALIHIGTEHNVRTVETTVIQPLVEIISELRKKNPNVKVVIMQIPRAWRNKRLNILTLYMAHQLSTPQSEIATVSLFWDWDASKDTFDGVHPNINGQNKMATKLYSALAQMIPIKENKNTQ